MFGKNEKINFRYAKKMSSLTKNFVYVDSSNNKDVLNLLIKNNINYISTSFKSWSNLRNNAYDYAKTSNYDWILILDADEYIEKHDLNKLESLNLDNYDGYFCKFEMYYCNKRLKYCRHRSRIRLVSVSRSRFDSNGSEEWVNCKKTGHINGFKIKNHDLNPFHKQILKQIHKASSEVHDSEKSNLEHSMIKKIILGFLNNSYFNFLKGFMYFIYHYFFRFGFLDGKAGFFYCFNYAFLYHIISNGINEFEK